MKKKKLQEALAAACEQIAFMRGAIDGQKKVNATQSKQISELRRAIAAQDESTSLEVQQLKDAVSRNESNISSLNILFNKSSDSITRVCGAMQDDQSEFRLDLATQVRRVLTSDISNPETELGGAVVNVVADVLFLREDCEQSQQPCPEAIDHG